MFDPSTAEVLQAKQVVESLGLHVGDFSFDMRSSPPESETPGMFVLRYEIVVTAAPLKYKRTFTGGAGVDWVEQFADDLKRHVKDSR